MRIKHLKDMLTAA